MNKKFNNQFATQKLRQETSATNFGGATFTPGTGEQMATNKAFKKKEKKEVKDVEPKYAAGKAKIYMKDKWGWKDAPSIPNRPSKGGFIYKQLFEGLNPTIQKLIDYMIQNKIQKKVVKLKPDSNLDKFMADIKPAVDQKILIARLNPIDKTELWVSLGPDAQKQFNIQELSQELSEFVKENEPVEEVFSKADYEKAKVILDKVRNTNSKLYNAILALASDIYPHDLEGELGADIQAAGLNEGLGNEIGDTVYFRGDIGEKYPTSQGYYGVIEDVIPARNYNMMAIYQVAVYDKSGNEITSVKGDWTNFTNKKSIQEGYAQFRNETKTRGKSDQFHQAIRAVKKKVQEINRLFEYVSRLKEELSEGQDGLKYKMHTEKALAKIKEMVSELNQNVKKFK